MDVMSILDPKTHKVTFFKMPVADPTLQTAQNPNSFGVLRPVVSKNSISRIRAARQNIMSRALQADSIHGSRERHVHSHRIFAANAGARHGRTTTGGVAAGIS